MYVTRAEIETEIPGPTLIEALDDDRDGAEDEGLFNALVASASQTVDAFLSARYYVPFVPPEPPGAREAAFAFLGEKVYARRQVTEKNPFTARANVWRERLAAISKGQANLEASTNSVASFGAAITSNSALEGGSR